MAPSRTPKDKNEIGEPTNLTLGGGGASGTQIVDIYQRLAGIERSISYLKAGSSDSALKLNAISGNIGDLAQEVSAAKSTFRTLQWVLGIVGGILILFGGFIGTIVTMAIKHYMHW